MNFEDSTILITGAAGGIGGATAERLGKAGARLLLTDLRPEPLEVRAADLRRRAIEVDCVACDIATPAGREALAIRAESQGVDVLVNVAGINPFGLLVEQTEAEIEQAIAINTIAPLLLCRALLPQLMRQPVAHIVNVGSVFGSLAFPGFAAYSASKFAVRGFTEAMRREFADTSVRFHYVAPRATRTALRTDRIAAMNAALGVAADPPETVAAAIEGALRRSRRETYLGRPERLFRLINSVLPGLIDRSLRLKLPIVRRFAAKSGGMAGPDQHSFQLQTLGVER